MSMTEASSNYFKDIANRWDDVRAGYFTEAVRETAIAKAYLHRSMVVADVGAGTGFIAAGLAPLVRRVYVVDGSEEMLDVARKNLDAFTNVEFHKADGLSLPFPDESLDAVFANMYLHHTTDPLASIREMVRVLRPGGRLVITDMDAHPYEWLKEEMADVWQGFDRADMRSLFRDAELVNVVVNNTGQTCNASADCADDACCAEGSTCGCATDKGGSEAKISIFVAAGTRRMAMRDAVQENYGAIASNSGSCCGGSSSSASAGLYELPADPQTIAAACCGGDSACGCSSTEAQIEIKPDYSKEELSSVPSEAAEITLGCGNPVAIAGLQPGEVVLDIGSGGGLDAFLSAGKVGPTGRVIGVDMTPAMLERARASAERAGITNVEFRQGFAEAMPVEADTVDVIISNCVINLSEDKGQVFREAFRVLKPGGRLEVSDVVLSGPVPIEVREQAQGWAACVNGALPESEYLDLVAQAGFKEINIRRSPAYGQALGVSAYSAIVSARK